MFNFNKLTLFFTILFSCLFLFLINPVKAQAAVLLGRVTTQSLSFPTCANNLYYLGNSCGEQPCSGSPNFTITWTQGASSDSTDNNGCTAGNPLYTFEGRSNPSGNSTGQDATINITVAGPYVGPTYAITTWYRDTTDNPGGIGNRCGIPPSSGSFPNTTMNQTVDIPIYDNTDVNGNRCQYNHVWFMNNSVNLFGRVVTNTGTPIPNIPITGCNIGNTTTDGSGNFSYSSINTDQSFCLRAPAIAGYTGPTTTYFFGPTSYECQFGGGHFNPDACNNFNGSSPGANGSNLPNLDVTLDDNYTFWYTPITTPTPANPYLNVTFRDTNGVPVAPNPPVCPYSWNCGTATGGGLAPPCSSASDQTIDMTGALYSCAGVKPQGAFASFANLVSVTPIPATGYDYVSTLKLYGFPVSGWVGGKTLNFVVQGSTPPTIGAGALQAKNAGTPSINGTFGISGRQTVENGSDWLNSMYIRQSATPGTAGNINLYATAFYDKKQGTAINQPALGFLSAIEGQINTDASRGFILAYSNAACANQSTNCPVDNTGFSFAAGQYYAYVRGSGWVNITGYSSNGYYINNNYGQQILKAYPYANGAYYGQWKVLYYALFASKDMYTAGYAVDSNNLSSFASNQTVTVLP